MQNPPHCLKRQLELPTLTSLQCQSKLSTRLPPILFPHLFHLTLILDVVPDVTLMTCMTMGFGSSISYDNLQNLVYQCKLYNPSNLESKIPIFKKKKNSQHHENMGNHNWRTGTNPGAGFGDNILSLALSLTYCETVQVSDHSMHQQHLPSRTTETIKWVSTKQKKKKKKKKKKKEPVN